MTIQNETKKSSLPLATTGISAVSLPARRHGCRYSLAVTDGLMAAIKRSPSHSSSSDVQERLWDVLWKASLSARGAKPGCSRIVFEVMLPIEGTTEKYHTLILNIRPEGTPEPLGMIGFPADFFEP
jgi:hypothetical protein